MPSSSHATHGAVADLGILIGGFLITQTTKWEVVRICASQNRPFFFSFFHIFTFSVHISSASSMEVIKKKKGLQKKRGKKKFLKNKVSLHRLVPGPLTLMDIGRSGDTLRINSK